MRQIATIICLCFALLSFSGCCDKPQTEYIYKKYPKPNIEQPVIEPKCDDVKCALTNYQKQKDYAAKLRAAIDEGME